MIRSNDRRFNNDVCLRLPLKCYNKQAGMIERGTSNPSLDTANAIAEALEIPFAKLIAEAEAVRLRAESVK